MRLPRLQIVLVLFLIVQVPHVSANGHKNIFVSVLSKYQPKTVKVCSHPNNNCETIEYISDELLLVNGLPQNQWNSKFLTNGFWTVIVGEVSRNYKGSLNLSPGSGSLKIINQVKINDYLAGVIAGEFAEADLEALKAQAVLARTLIYRKLRTLDNDSGVDIGDLTNEQVYTGFVPYRKFARAVAETDRLVITFKGHLIEPFWHSTCGNRFLSPKQAWNGPELAYITSGIVQSKYHCKRYPHYKWQRQMSRNKLSDILEMAIPKVGYPRYTEFGIDLGPENPMMSPETFRLALNRVAGWNFLKSNDYTIEYTENDIIFSGNGLGHNIGLCQCQAQEMARDKLDFKQIIQFYFRGISIEKWAD